MIREHYTTVDIKIILAEMIANLPSNKYDVGQKVRSELCSKLVEQINAIHFSQKLGIRVVPGKADVDPDNLYIFPSGLFPLEIKVAQTVSKDTRVRFRGGALSDRNSEYLFIVRNRDCTKFFAAITYMTKENWVAQNTAYYAPYFDETMLFNKDTKVLFGSFDVAMKGKRMGLPILKLESLSVSTDNK
jgi:hypothetical protein